MTKAVALATAVDSRPGVEPVVLAAAFDGLPHGVLLFDAEERLIYWNKTILELLPNVYPSLHTGQTVAEISGRLDNLQDVGLVRHWRRASADLLILSVLRADGDRVVVGGTAQEKTRQRLIDAIEYLSHGLAIFDENDRLILSNRRFRQFFPQAQIDKITGTTYGEFIRSLAEEWMSDPAAIRRWVEEHVERRRFGLTHECKTPEGRWFLVRDLRLPDGSTVMTGTDITGLKNREQALRESEARFRTIFQNAPIGFVVIRSGGRIIQANQALLSMLGYHADELAAMCYADLVYPEDLTAEATLARQLVAGVIDSYRHETRYLRKDGRTFWGRLTVTLVRGQGTDNFAIAMIEDIDERKRAEADLSTFRAVVEAAAEAIVILSSNGDTFYLNPAHGKLFGRNAEQHEPGGYLRNYTEMSQEIVRQMVEPALADGTGWEGVLDAKDLNGRVFPLWQRAGTVFDDGGRPKFYFFFMHDHSAQQQIRDELCKAKEVAEQANMAKTRFLAAASHDLRQPLQALSMFVTVLAGREHTPEDAALIQRIEDSAGALETLLNGLLDVSKLEAGLVEPVLTAFDVGRLLSRLAAEFGPLVNEAGLDFHYVPSSAPIQSDPALLERILRNLLNNAVRYTKSGRILLGCRRRGDILRIEVWDTGIGIPHDQLPLIFREFHQLGNSARDRRQGLGLGLTIVDRLVQLLGHRIDVASEPRKGSVFAIEVPRAVVASPVSPPPPLPVDRHGGHATILVIEDEPDVLESTCLLLEAWGFSVLPSRNCDEALRHLADVQKRPDLILADYRLQGGATGAQAISRIRARFRSSLPAIILTGDTAPERLRQAKASGHGLLHKPVQPGALHQMIDELLMQPQTFPRPKVLA
ncbi:PAS domain S-box protein [Telmatospirillum sp.]|uniref:PAS domain S-box protein n=1 Tax=Telmatospirillum sp. TaxID=2079197 RepID=UPI0028433352|nr:PAS domain S-box protein [Telmatospirillum sp.]MDR3435701.1 PAS domain S-box protein [Telmatospirillum sp.]